MRTATASDNFGSRLETVLTATASIEQFREIWNAMPRSDALESPGPSRSLNVTLSTRHNAVVVFHERLSFIEILAPLEIGVEEGLADLLVKLDVRPDAITWTHDRIDRRTLVTVSEKPAR